MKKKKNIYPLQIREKGKAKKSKKVTHTHIKTKKNRMSLYDTDVERDTRVRSERCRLHVGMFWLVSSEGKRGGGGWERTCREICM